jgi:hypothetical protein
MDIVDVVARNLMAVDGIRRVFVEENFIKSEMLKNFSVMHF